jgi:hypothetical protein
MNDPINTRTETGQRVTMEIGHELYVEVEGVQTQLRSHLVGMEPGRFLVLAMPETKIPGGVGYKFAPGKPVVVRYLHRGTIFGFETLVIDSIAQPARLIFLRCPRIVEERDIRERRRVDCFLPVTLKIGDKDIEGMVTDISETGCKCRIKTTLLAAEKIGADAIPATLPLTLGQIGGAESLAVNAAVRNRRQDRERTELGLAFQDLTDELRAKLNAFISSSE